MIEAIYVWMLILYIVLIISVKLEEFYIGALVSIGLIVCGVYLLAGHSYLDNFLTLAIGVVTASIGSFIFIQGSLEQITQS